MGRKYAIRDQESLYFVTFTVVNWIDVFIRNEYRQIIIDSLKYCQQNKSLCIHAYCIMTSHIHLILSVKQDFNLSNVIRDFKSFTSRQLKECIKNNQLESRREWMMWMFERAADKNKRNNGFQFWQQHNHPIELDTSFILEQKIDYIHNNPVEAGFVDNPTTWKWSSCACYEKEIKCDLDLDYV